MIFVAFLVPLALYLLLLGWVNRQPRPMFVSGPIDFVGVLFAASGFLLVGGPAALSAANENWRMFWLLGETASPAEGALEAPRQAWMIVAGLYFVVVVAVCAVVLWRRRAITCVYNVEPAAVDSALAEACARLGLAPIRSGGLYVFGLSAGPGEVRHPEGIQAPHVRPRSGQAPVRSEEYGGQSGILEVEPFEAMKHVTLRWEPADTPLRAAVEGELERRLAAAGSPYHETAGWLGLMGSSLLVLSAAVLFVLVLRRLMAG